MLRGKKSSLSERINRGFHHIFWKSWVFLHVCTVKQKRFFSALRCGSPAKTLTKDRFGEATTQQDLILKVDMWFLKDTSYCKWHFGFVLAMALNGWWRRHGFELCYCDPMTFSPSAKSVFKCPSKSLYTHNANEQSSIRTKSFFVVVFAYVFAAPFHRHVSAFYN